MCAVSRFKSELRLPNGMTLYGFACAVNGSRRLVALFAALCVLASPFPGSASTFIPQSSEPLDPGTLDQLPEPDENGFIAIDDMLFRAGDVIQSGFVGNPWPGGVLVYSFDSSVNATEQSQWLFAAAQWSTVANLTFVQRTSQTNYVRVVDSGPGGSNSSFVGMVGGAQTMNISSWGATYVIAHEIGHALGLMHEHQRSDRNTYVTINTANIQPGAGGNFTIASTTNFGLYDFDSVMHYDGCAFSIDCAAGTSCGCVRRTITVLPPNDSWQGQIGQHTHLSYDDHRGMGLRYGCLTPSPPFPISPPNGMTDAPASGVFDWTEPGGVSSYRLLVLCASGDTAISTEVTLSHYVYTLSAGTYTWSVQSVNPCGLVSPPLTEYTVTVAGPPCVATQTPVPPSGATCQPRAGRLRWNPVAGVTGYTVRLGTSCGVGAESFVTAAEFDYSGLTANTTYHWEVRPACPCGPDPQCFNFVTGDGQAAPAPLPHEPFPGAFDQPLSGTLSWGAPAAVSEFEVQLGLGCGSGPVFQTTEPLYAYSGLFANYTYFWRARARVACGDWSAYSQCRSFTTAGPSGADRVYVSPQTLAVGQTLAEIPVRLENLGDLKGFEFRVRLSTDVFDVLGWSQGGSRSESAASVQVDIDPAVAPGEAEVHGQVTFPAGGTCPPPFAPGNGTALRILVEVLPGAPIGATAVLVMAGDFVPCTGAPFTPALLPGTVQITAPVLEAPALAGSPTKLDVRLEGPNPTTGPVAFRVGLPASHRTRMSIFDLSGREVARPLDGVRAAGWHRLVWNGLGHDGRPVPSGVYLVRVTAGRESRGERVVRVR